MFSLPNIPIKSVPRTLTLFGAWGRRTSFRQPRRLFGPTILDFHLLVFWYPITFVFILILLENAYKECGEDLNRNPA